MMMENRSDQNSGSDDPRSGAEPATPAAGALAGNAPAASAQNNAQNAAAAAADIGTPMGAIAPRADSGATDCADSGAGACADSGAGACADSRAGDCRICGTVKWFDAIKGYGFVTVDDGQGDILIHYKLLAPHQRKSLPDGTAVTLLVRDGPRGRQGTEILAIDFSTAAADCAATPMPLRGGALASADIAGADIAGDGFETVQVRWFNRTKGYGFLLRNDGTTEVFIHMETVRRGGFGTLLAGQQLLAAIEDGPRGAHAIAIRAHPAPRG